MIGAIDRLESNLHGIANIMKTGVMLRKQSIFRFKINYIECWSLHPTSADALSIAISFNAVKVIYTTAKGSDTCIDLNICFVSQYYLDDINQRLDFKSC